MTKKIKGNKGFTLIEIIVAIAIIGLLSGTLLQMFVLSTKMNSKADNLDKANTLATSIAEDFKSGTQADLFFKGKSVSVFDEKESTPVEGKRQYDKSYDANWKPAEGVNPSFSLTATVWMGSTQKGTTNVFTPDISASIKIGTNSTLEVNDSSYAVDGGIGHPYGKDISSLKTIGFRVEGAGNCIIEVTNNTSSNKPVELYFYQTDKENQIQLKPVKGESRISTIPMAEITEGDDTKLNQYLMEIKIVRLEDDAVLTDYTVSRYFTKAGDD